MCYIYISGSSIQFSDVTAIVPIELPVIETGPHPDAVQVRGVGNWILVKYDFGNREKCFVGEIKVQLNDGHNANIQKWTVHFLKRIGRSGSTFRDSLSANQATDDIDDDDVVTILPCPRVIRGIYTFVFDFSGYIVE